MRGVSNKTKIDYQRVIKRYDELKEQRKREETGKSVRQCSYLGEQYYYDLISEETGYEPCSVRKIVNNLIRYMRLYCFNS